jgi:hypothetical protein
MINGGDRANIFAEHAGDITGPIHGDSVKGADKGLRLWTNGHAGTAVYAGIPANIE